MTSREAEKQKKARRLARRRVEYPRQVMAWWKEVMRERIERTFDLVDFRAFRGDLHTHSTYSDGVGTVDELKAVADAAGLDFFFVTDHGTVNQKRSCRKYEHVWWGQEPGTQYHHLGILGIDRKYTPKQDLVYDYRRVQALGGFPFIPHPAGWFPGTRYSEEQKDALNLLGDAFAIEIINGANQVFDCYDVTDEQSIELWDQHLSQGKRVIALGNSDAHLAEGIGDIWNGVFCEALEKNAVMDAVRKGHCFVSDAPLVRIELNGARMGDVVRVERGSEIKLSFECADSLGLTVIRVIKNGAVLETIQPDGQVRVARTVTDRFGDGKSYYRVECLAADRRRAYSNPIYVWEK